MPHAPPNPPQITRGTLRSNPSPYNVDAGIAEWACRELSPNTSFDLNDPGEDLTMRQISTPMTPGQGTRSRPNCDWRTCVVASTIQVYSVHSLDYCW